VTLGHLESTTGIKSLVKLAEDKSPEQREFLYKKIGNYLVDEGTTLSSPEKAIMVDIICHITSDVEKSIRSHFAKQLVDVPDVPKDLLVFLANDEIEVALPILKDCGLLEEPDLLQIIKHRSIQHQMAVAARENISEEVCKAICDIGNTDVTVTLLENHSAQMPLLLLNYLGEQSEFIPDFQQPLLLRPFLPQAVAEKMYRWVSVALREFILENFDVDPKALNVDVHDREETINSISIDNDPSVRMVDKLHNAGELTTGFMVKSLQQGEIDLFEAAFAKLLGYEVNMAKYIIYSENPEVLAVACRCLDLDRIIFKTIYGLTISTSDKESSILSPSKPAPMEFYDLLTEASAGKAMQNMDFMQGKIKYSETN
jgi:uncharacterized protein (DUF2336 family)